MSRISLIIFGFLLLFITAKLSYADDNLIRIPYEPSTDLPKLAIDLGINADSVELHSRCAYIHLNEWSATAKTQSINTCVAILTHDNLIFATWKPDSKTYATLISLTYSDMTQIALSIEDSKHQLQLTTSVGLLAITTVNSQRESTGAIEFFDQLAVKGITTSDSPGRIDWAVMNRKYKLVKVFTKKRR
jgi:uncharacterized protein YchJ